MLFKLKIIIPASMVEKPTKDIRFNESLKKKYPASMFNMKLIPVAIGMIKEKFPIDKDLKNTKAEKTISPNAIITWKLRRN